MIEVYNSVVTFLVLFAIFGWIISLGTKNVTHVDSMWSIFFVIAMAVVAVNQTEITDRHIAFITALLLWASRLSIYLTIRNWGAPEDIRYRNIRANNEPNFHIKSIYIIFLLQAFLAAIIVLPVVAILIDERPYDVKDKLSLAIILFGLVFQTIADTQLSNFLKKDNKRAVLSTGLWKYSRHPNYFGECLIWWGFFIAAIGDYFWVILLSPILMTVLLLKISGVGLMEQTITSRRPGYKNYVKNTSSFLPWPPKKL
jgi:steroid 5-alpha reductase family enzyme